MNLAEKKNSWNNCQHEWEEAGDYELGGGRTEGVCIKCGAPGERPDATGEITWMTT